MIRFAYREVIAFDGKTECGSEYSPATKKWSGTQGNPHGQCMGIPARRVFQASQNKGEVK